MIPTIIALALPTILGFLVIAIILRGDDSSIPERLCLAYPIGAAILTMMIFILGILRIPLRLQYIIPLLITGIALLSAWIWRKRIPLLPSYQPSSTKDNTSRKKPFTIKTVLIAILSIWAITKLGSIFLETYLRPIFAWDSWANWSAGAKLFYHTEGLLLDVPPEEFFGKGAVLRITSYPLHNPLMQAWISMWVGSFDEVMVKFWSPLYLLCLTTYLYIFIVREINRLTASVFVVTFLSSPLMSYHSIEVYSDLCLSTYLFFALISFVNMMRGGKNYLLLIGLFSAGSMFVKDEALFFVIPLILSVTVFLLKNRYEIKDFITILTPFIYILPWYAFKFYYPLGLGADIIKFEFVYHPEIIKNVAISFLSLDNFNIFFIFFPILLLTGGKPPREFIHIFFVVICYMVFFIMLYAFTSFYYDHFLKGTVFYRNVLTYYPSICLLTVLLIKDIKGSIPNSIK